MTKSGIYDGYNYLANRDPVSNRNMQPGDEREQEHWAPYCRWKIQGAEECIAARLRRAANHQPLALEENRASGTSARKQ